MKFTYKEKIDLTLAGIIISLAFTILFSGEFNGIFSGGFYVFFIISFLTAGIGFLFHELMHKYVAQRYGLSAEFKAFYVMLFFALLASFFGFIIAAPGAVFIRGTITKEKNGKISFAGPATNLVLAILFLLLILIFGTKGAIGSFFKFGLIINSLLASFNMIPIMPFDGAKIMAWNKKIYFITLILGIGLFILSNLF